MDIIEDFVEGAAIAVYHRDCPDVEGTSLGWRVSAHQLEFGNVARAAIKSYLRQIEEAGFAIVPAEPTGDMIRAAADGRDYPALSFLEIYKAMIAAYAGD